MLASVYSSYSRHDCTLRLNYIYSLMYISAGNSKAYCFWLYPPLLSILSWTQTPECDLYPWFLHYTSLPPVKFNESGFFLNYGMLFYSDNLSLSFCPELLAPGFKLINKEHTKGVVFCTKPIFKICFLDNFNTKVCSFSLLDLAAKSDRVKPPY